MKVIFLDRDNTLNEDPGYLSDPEKVRLLPKVIEGLTILKNLNFEFIIITNQSGIGRKYFSLEDLNLVNHKLLELLQKESISIKKIFFCPHTDQDHCNCRKPKPGLIQRALEEFPDIDLNTSWIIGDRIRDILPGEPFLIKGILLSDSYPDFSKHPKPSNLITISKDLQDAAIQIQNFESLKTYNKIKI